MSVNENTTKETTCWLMTTGALKAASTSNIYDLGENEWKLTMEQEQFGTKVYSITRGCNYYDDGPMSTRDIGSAFIGGHGCGFRPALYIK